MSYLIILLADVALSGSFVFQKMFQNREGNAASTGFAYNALTGLFSALLFFAIGGFHLRLSAFSIVAALVQTVCVVGYTLLGFQVLKSGNLSLYTLFLMTGGMILPYIYGVAFLEETFSAARCMGLVLITGAVILSNLNLAKASKKQVLLCFLIFILNGLVSITSKIHQIDTAHHAVSSTEFVVLTNILKFILCMPISRICRKTGIRVSTEKNALLIMLGAAVLSGLSYFLQLAGAKNIPASVLYPLVTGGSIILCTLSAWLAFHEKPTKAQISGIAVCVLGTCFFL